MNVDSCALRIFDAATICMARVICEVLPIDLMAPANLTKAGHISPCCAFPGIREIVGGSLQLGPQSVAQRLLFLDLGKQFHFPGRQEVRKLVLERLDLLTGT